MRHLSGFITKTMRKHTNARGFYEPALLTQWGQILPEYKDYVQPLKFYKGSLTLAVLDDSAKMHMLMLIPDITNRINTFLGFEAVTKINLKTHYFEPVKVKTFDALTPSANAKAAAEKRCAHVEDEGLRASLTKLAEYIEAEKELNIV